MKVIVIGNAGTGKSTFCRELARRTGWPLLALDRLWHTTDYSPAAKGWFAREQRRFMAAGSDWIIDGNYGGTLRQRVSNADLVVWCQAPRLVALGRVLRRSWRFRQDPNSRPDMAAGFQEHFDRAYLDFLRYVWAYPRRSAVTTQPLVQLYARQVVVVHHLAEKGRLLADLSESALK